MGVLFLHKDETVRDIALGALPVFLNITRMVQAELGGMACGFSPLVSDEIWIDKRTFVEFVDEFFRRAEHEGKFRYFAYWAQEVAGMYEKVAGTAPPRKMSGVKDFKPVRYR